MWAPCPVCMSSTYAKRRRVQRSHFKLSTSFILTFLLHVSLHYLGTMASPMVRKAVGYTPGSCQNGWEKCSEVLAGKAAQKRNQYWWQCSKGFPAKMCRDAWKKFSMLCCLQFLKSTLRHESDLLSIHGWHFQKSQAI